MSLVRESFWKRHYKDVFSKKLLCLDYSNELCQAQSFALALETAGPIAGKKILDVGCGWGQLALALAGFKAASVTGIDIVEEAIINHKKEHPELEWICGSPLGKTVIKHLKSYDLIFLVEILQYLDVRATLTTLWNNLNPGGRLIGIVPHKNCQFVNRAVNRFSGNYRPTDEKELQEIICRLPDVAKSFFRGMFLQEDQNISPYLVPPWNSNPQWSKAPNRILFAITKQFNGENIS